MVNNNMNQNKNIGFDVLEKNEEEVVLKRVLPLKNGKPRHDVELSLPKLSVHYFDIDDLEILQAIAEEMAKRIAKNREKRSLRYRIISIFKL